MINQLANLSLDDFKKLMHIEFTQQQQLEMIERRNQLIKFDVDAPQYLLEHEVKQFFSFVENYNELMLLKFLWVTGSRITEALLVTPSNFIFGIDSCLMTLPTQKKRKLVKKVELIDENGIKRISPIYESARGVRHIQISKQNESQSLFIDDLRRYIVTNKTGQNQLLFNYTRFQAYRFIKKVQSIAEKNNVNFPFEVTPHTFRHSCAMNLVYNNVDERIIQKYLGHSRIENTRKYTKIFHLENDLSHVNF
ncbi:tyrosine-type recombinase/integrase [Gilliamella sp. W8126]|uniref:tyrosine-type recombinase/integrase n=1 Tax=Gilliamella sp. W8126 TaxID=2750946 RepID=UPI0018DB61C4|nr:tyrosine-type recombinase/integrase [Gilliamella sp. W8126]MBI0007003.1 tyrosine-type recombinase/integrase [Gilliamella sp. W8126]